MAVKVLVVEDDKDIRRNMQRLLESEGYAVEVAANGRIALDALAAMPALPALIILDLMMPVMDGFQFREAEAKSDRIAQIPVVIMTADGHIDEKRAQTGAHASLRKPADVDAILQVVADLCRGAS